MPALNKITFALLLLFLSACQENTLGRPIFHAEGKPKKLSQWNVVGVQQSRLVLADKTVAYDLNTPLFSDYAHKLRTVWVPEDTPARYHETELFGFPVGTIISKTFYYPTNEGESASSPAVLQRPDESAQRLINGFNLNTVKLIETRLLVHRDSGWVAMSYVWNDNETDATLKRTGDIKQLELIDSGQNRTAFSYVVPNENQCAGCHATNATTRKIHPIGPKSRHLNKDYLYASGRRNQIDAWTALGILKNAPPQPISNANALWNNPNQSVNDRARAYLDINCSHCHNRVGPADTSGLYLEPNENEGPNLGICKQPIAAGNGTGGRKFSIVPGNPDESIVSFRMKSKDPAVMMPELGRSLSHKEGVELLDAWITEMDGSCEL